jgi:uncharacterized OB-fold protein
MTNNQQYGWICPKCGVPNNPNNSTCQSCKTEASVQTQNKWTPTNEYITNHNTNKQLLTED